MTKAATILGYIMIISLEILLLAIICGFMYVALRSDDPEAEAAFQLGASIMIFVAMLFNSLLYCYWDELSVAISIVNSAAGFFVATKRIIYISLICVVLGILVLYLCSAGMVCIISVNIIALKKQFLETQTKPMNMEEFSLPIWIHFVAYYKIFVCLWLLCLIHGNCQWITFFSTSSYYFDSNIDKEGEANVELAIKNSIIYHQGSIILGSLIHPILIPINEIIERIFDFSSEKKPIKFFHRLGKHLVNFRDGAFLSINKHAFAY